MQTPHLDRVLALATPGGEPGAVRTYDRINPRTGARETVSAYQRVGEHIQAAQQYHARGDFEMARAHANAGADIARANGLPAIARNLYRAGGQPPAGVHPERVAQHNEISRLHLEAAASRLQYRPA